MDIRPCLMDLGMNRESCSVDGLIANHDLTILVDQDEIAYADLRKVSR